MTTQIQAVLYEVSSRKCPNCKTLLSQQQNTTWVATVLLSGTKAHHVTGTTREDAYLGIVNWVAANVDKGAVIDSL